MDLQRRSGSNLSSAMPGVSVRRFLSEDGEKEALCVLKEQLRRQKRVTSDDVRLAVRAVASQGGAVPLPPDFPPSRWVLEFKRVHGFMQFSSFAFGAAVGGSSSKTLTAFGLSERLEVPPLRSVAVAAANSQRAATTSSNSHNTINGKSNSGSSAVQVTASSLNPGNNSDDEKEKEPSEDSRDSLSYSAVAYSGPRSPYHSETQRQVQLKHGFSQRHRHYLQQQQRRAMLVGDRRQAACPRPARDSTAAADHDEMQSNWSSGSENGTTTGPSNSPSGGVGPVGPGIRSMPPLTSHTVSINSTNSEDTVSNTSSSKDKRGYKLSHTVPSETWEKAIAAVEQQGMSLRAAAKMYGVHFAALHRRVKKRAQGGQLKGNNGYFHPSDEAGIMRVVVARAELGVLMTFDELMRLVEAAALRKLPDISVDSARNLLTRFHSRNEQSIRHIIVDWPPPRPTVAVSSGEVERPQHQPYLEHPGFDFGPKPPVILRSLSSGGGSSKTTTVAAMAAAAKTNLFIPPSRLGPLPSSVRSPVDEMRRPRMRFMNGNGGLAMDNGALPGVSNERLRFVGSRARSEGDNDPVMVV